MDSAFCYALVCLRQECDILLDKIAKGYPLTEIESLEESMYLVEITLDILREGEVK